MAAVGTAAANTSKPVRTGAVPGALRELRDSIAELEANIGALVERLEPVSGMPPKDANVGDCARAAQCEVAETITSARERIQYMNARVLAQLEALEV